MASPLISVGGLASGMDTDAVISQLLTLERQPRTRLELRQTALQARQDVLRDVASKLNALRDAGQALRSAATWGDVQKAESSDPTKLGVRLTSGAAPGGLSVAVTSLASAAQRTYTYTPQAGASQLTIGGTTVDLAAGATLSDTVNAINATSATGVYAVDVGGQLVLSSRATGSAASAVGTGAALAEVPGSERAGSDAVFTVGTTSYTRSSNVVTDAVAGVELSLKATGTASFTVSAPRPDPQVVEDKVKAFVDAYNIAADLLRTKLGEKRVPGAATAADARKGALFGDTGLAAAQSQLRQAMAGFEDLGISTGAATTGTTLNQDAVMGKVTFDKAKLTAALESGTAKARLETLAEGLSSVLSPLAGSGGVVDQRVTATGNELTAMRSALARFDERLASKEERLRAQFTALEVALSRNNSIAADLASRLGG
jgi:flagellar hook-associated protein 2